MNKFELVSACTAYLPPELLAELIKALNRKGKQAVVPTPQEELRFEELWRVRKQYPARNGGDPKKTALETFCVRMRAKPADQDHIIFGIKCEYSKSVKDTASLCQMETFMSQRRWESYTYTPSQAQDNVVQIRPVQTVLPSNHFSRMYQPKQVQS